MRLLTFASVSALLASTCQAHTLFTTLYVNGANQGDAYGIRMPTNVEGATDPVEDLTSNNMACGIDGDKGVARVVSVPQSAALTFEFRLWPDGSNPGSIDVSHKGPCAVYMKKVDNAITDVGFGNGWFKIWDRGYDLTTSKWCTEEVIENNGLLSVNIPSDLASGPWLVRTELLALQSAEINDPQFYVGCAQIFYTSTGTSLPADTVSIPGHVKAGDASVSFNVYQPTWPYTIPGPAAYKSGSSSARLVKDSALVQKLGLPPANCILENCNWCGVEVADYTTEAGCYAASQSCWEQADACYANAGPTGSKNCKLWEAKCDTIQAACAAGDFNGPPNKNKVLTSPLSTISVPAPAATANSAADSATKSAAKAVSNPVKAASSSTLQISIEGNCGSGTTCQGSTFGNCCSHAGYCGSTTDYCGSGCQADFGTCEASSKSRRSHIHQHKRAHDARFGGRRV